jgi:hypothetical protein
MSNFIQSILKAQEKMPSQLDQNTNDIGIKIRV